MIYFDNAATTGKKPISSVNAVVDAMKNYCANPGRSGHNLSVETAVKIYETREALASFFGCNEPQNVAFTLNCTHAINCVIKGLVDRNEQVVVSSLEHNAVMRPLYEVGAKVDVVKVSLYDDEETLNGFRNLVNENTRLVICTGASNVIGKKLPIEKIGALCKEKNVPFAVDGAQIAGTSEIDMQKQNIDFLCLAPHKGLYAPTSTGVLIARKPLKRSLIEGGTGSDSINLSHPLALPESVEAGTVNVPGIFGIKGGLDFVKMKGTSSIKRYEDMLCDRLFRGLKENKNVMLYCNYNSKLFSPVISFNFKDYGSEQTAAKLNEKGIAVRAGLHCAPTAHRQIGTIERGTVRVCPSVFNTKAEVDYLIKVLKYI